MIKDYYNALLTGTMLEEYKIIRVLGCGSFGMTYLANDTRLNMQVAIKEYLPRTLIIRQGSAILTTSTDSGIAFAWGLKRFEQEAQILGHFRHPNVVQELRYFAANGTGYMVMRYEDGLSLDNILQRTSLTEAELTQNILLPLMDALKHVHAAGFLHQDIKPANIYMRRSDEMPILLDFGEARYAMGEKSHDLSVVLTDGYAPFEQYDKDGNQGPWTDIYALAAVAYYVVTGSKPPVSTSRMKHDKMRPASEVGSRSYSKQFLKTIDHALAVNIDDRPQSCEDWAHELLDAQGRGDYQLNNADPDKGEAIIEQDDKSAVRFFSKLFNGDFGLAKTYWLYGVLVGLVVGISTLFIPSFEVIVIVLLVYLLYAILLAKGIWRAASNRDEGKKIWAVLAKISTVLGILSFIAGLYGLFMLRYAFG